MSAAHQRHRLDGKHVAATRARSAAQYHRHEEVHERRVSDDALGIEPVPLRAAELHHEGKEEANRRDRGCKGGWIHQGAHQAFAEVEAEAEVTRKKKEERRKKEGGLGLEASGIKGAMKPPIRT